MFAKIHIITLFCILICVKNLASQQAKWSLNIIKNKEYKLAGDQEPGFDLDEEEMQKFKLWPQGIIPYYIDTTSFYDKVLRDRIRTFLNAVNSLTSLRFIELPSPPTDDNTRWVLFLNRRGLLGCADHSIKNFTTEGVQAVVLGYDCMNSGGELAEAVLAIAGVPPQHNAPNRDDFITVKPNNIIPGKEYLFKILKDDEWLFHDMKYDFLSAGHYHPHKYSRNGQATINVHTVGDIFLVGEGIGFSYTDISKIRALYNYITKNKRGNMPDCHKMFAPGANFSNYRPVKNDLQPRNKPDKYLGISDEENNVPDKEYNKLDSDEEEKSDEAQNKESSYDGLAENPELSNDKYISNRAELDGGYVT